MTRHLNMSNASTQCVFPCFRCYSCFHRVLPFAGYDFRHILYTKVIQRATDPNGCVAWKRQNRECAMGKRSAAEYS